MNRHELEGRSDEELSHYLTERWAYRGGVLAMLAVLAILLTVFSSRGLASLLDQIVAGVLLICCLVAIGVFVVLRQQDRAIYRDLRERRRRRG